MYLFPSEVLAQFDRSVCILLPAWMGIRSSMRKESKSYLLPYSLPGSALGALSGGMADSLEAAVERGGEETTGMKQPSSRGLLPHCFTCSLENALGQLLQRQLCLCRCCQTSPSPPTHMGLCCRQAPPDCYHTLEQGNSLVMKRGKLGKTRKFQERLELANLFTARSVIGFSSRPPTGNWPMEWWPCRDKPQLWVPGWLWRLWAGLFSLLSALLAPGQPTPVIPPTPWLSSPPPTIASYFPLDTQGVP